MTPDEPTPRPPTPERRALVVPGWVALALDAAVLAGGILLAARHGPRGAGVLLIVAAALLAAGFIVVQPNESRVLVVLGRYAGTALQGFWWANPLSALSRRRISLRVRNFQSERLKVNDSSGNPIEIAAVVVWRIWETARASFDVEDVGQFVRVQSEAAVRDLAARYPYDDYTGDAVSLRHNSGEVLETLSGELRRRLETAGVEVLETRLTHLAYAPEIAEVMLRRQQAEALVAARRTMVAGAVGLVTMALEQLAESDLAQLDPERKAAMVSNLMVVLSGDHSPAPVINTGTLYT
ncbi:MAG TPA: SPFH domain-containing protein [Solirubrobacteraceae bacterium]|nr:SPFH domain-containing protein [Solirubrobacteraceae bacterium]